MPTKHGGNGIVFGDVLKLLEDCEDHHGVKVRLSVVPRPGTGYRQGCIFLATPYHPNGKRMAEVEAEQHLWPSSGHRTPDGLWVYLITRLSGTLDEREHRWAREAQVQEAERLTPLEQYIARSF